MPAEQITEPDETAVRTALWRAMHVQVDPLPHVLEDEVGLRLVAPEQSWRSRPDMAGPVMMGFRAGIVARARLVADLIVERCADGVTQYVILGAGLDSFAQRRPEFARRLRVFEIDQPATQAWKRQRLAELGYGVPDWLRLVPVDFETDRSWWDRLVEAGFDPARPVVLACTGVIPYLTRDAVIDTLHQAAQAAPGSILALTFVLTTAFDNPRTGPDGRPVEQPKDGPKSKFRSLFTPEDMLDLARAAGFREVTHLSTQDVTERYFAGRADDFRPSGGESFLLATT